MKVEDIYHFPSFQWEGGGKEGKNEGKKDRRKEIYEQKDCFSDRLPPLIPCIPVKCLLV